MRKVILALIGCLVCPGVSEAQTASVSDFYFGTNPGNPIAGVGRLWGNVASGLVECKTSTGANCFATGGGGGGAVNSVFGRVGNVVATTGDYTSAQVTEAAPNLYFTNARVYASLSATAPLTFNNTTGVFACPTCGSVTSVFGRTGAVVATAGDYTSAQVTEAAPNLYFTNARVYASLSATAPLTFNSGTGVFACPTCSTSAGGVTSVFGRTGVVLATAGDYTSAQVTEAAPNLYFTNARVYASLSATAPLTFNNTTGVFACPTCGTGTGGITGPSTTTVGNVPQWSNTTGTAVGAGLPVTQASTPNALVETGAGGTIAASTTGNAATATALAGAPAQCIGGQFATGITAAGAANCASGVAGPGTTTIGNVPEWSNTTGTAIGVGLPVTQASAPNALVETGAAGTIAASTTGNAATATALGATPTQCTGGQFATGITAAGAANCAGLSATAPITFTAATGVIACPTCSTSAGGVTSVFGRTGAVVAATGDYTVGQVTNAESVLNKNTNGGYVGRDATGNATIPGTMVAAAFQSSDTTHTSLVSMIPGLNTNFASSIPTGDWGLFLDSSNSNKLTRQDSMGNKVVVENATTTVAGAPYVQSFTNATSVSLTHNLNLSPVTAFNLNCFDTTNTLILPSSVVATNANTVTATFAVSTSGSCTVTTGGNGPAAGGTTTVGNVTIAVPVTALAANSCDATATTGTVTGAAVATDTWAASPTGDPTATVGYGGGTSGGITMWLWISANTVNLKRCNQSGASITPGALSLLVKVLR